MNDPPTANDAPANRVRRRSLLPTRLQALAAFAVAALLLVLIDAFLVESVVVPTSSMEPTLLPNERLLLHKWPRADISRFDVVVVSSDKLGKRIVKRVIGLPKETVQIEAGWRVRINGEALPCSATSDAALWNESDHHLIRVHTAAPTGIAIPTRSITLGDDEYFVMGDNRLESNDSRSIGPIHRADIDGAVGLIWHSYDLGQGHVRWNRLLHACR
jgi:signal peptidase I